MRCTNPLVLPNPLYQEQIDSYLRLNTDRNKLAFSHPEWFLLVPCGKCLSCLKAKSSEWALRCLHEYVSCDRKAIFVTLTYDEEHLPKVFHCVRAKDGKSPVVGTLVKSDFQKFVKRVRKFTNCRYFACGEYGSNTFRPHYHAILFGLDQDDFKLIQSCWKFGKVDFGEVNVKTIQYVCGYVQKKLFGKVSSIVYHFRQKPFQLQSQGLGRDYFDKHKSDVLERLGIYRNGVKVSTPRYYLNRDEDFKVAYSEACNLVEESKEQLVDYFERCYEINQSNRQRNLDLVREFQIKNSRRRSEL